MAGPERSLRGQDFEASPSAMLGNQRYRLKREKRGIVNFAGGSSTSPHRRKSYQEGVKALQEEYIRYAEDAGLLELRNAVGKKLARENECDECRIFKWRYDG